MRNHRIHDGDDVFRISCRRPTFLEVLIERSIKALSAPPCPESATGDRREGQGEEKDVMHHDNEELPRPPVKTDNPSRQETSEALLNGRTGRFSPACSG